VSIDQQIQAGKEFAARNNIEIVKIFTDRALTGTNDRRPDFQNMIKEAKVSDWDYIIVYTLDRFARDRYDSAIYKRQLKEAGVKVLSAMENISDDPTGVLVESLLEGLAEYYSKELSRKIRRGMSDNAQKCMVNGSVPLGYVRGADGRYAICEAEADIVREIFRRVLKDEPFVQIIEDLNARCILTKKGKPWNKSSFNKILTNERYAGVYIYGDVRIPGGIPAIIDQATFDAVQLKLHTKRNPRKGAAPVRRRRESGTYLLTGKLFCGHCRSPMVGISGTGKSSALHFYYTCRGKRETHTCTKKNVRRDHVEHRIATALRDTMLTDAAIAVLADAAVAYQAAQQQNTEIAALRNRLADIDCSLSNLMAAIEAGIFTASTRDRLTELESQKRTVATQLAQEEAAAESILTREEIIAALELFQHGDINDKDYQEALIDTFLVAAYLYDDKLRIVFHLDGQRKDQTLPFDIDSLSPVDPDPPAGVCISPSPLHQTLLYEPFGTAVVMIADLFVFDIIP
jgi:DNA invertase Pin-like site-specific DNA recombinase